MSRRAEVGGGVRGAWHGLNDSISMLTTLNSRQVESRESRVACGVFSFRLKSADGILGAALFVPLGAARQGERGEGGRVRGMRVKDVCAADLA